MLPTRMLWPPISFTAWKPTSSLGSSPTNTGVRPEIGQDLDTHLAKRWPFVEVRSYEGGQPQPLVLGVE